MPVLAEPRQEAIIALLRSGGQVMVSDLAKRLNVSEMTIRRDLDVLEERGLAVRVHGGALYPGNVRFSDRLSAHAGSKAKAAGKLAKFLPESGCIYLDGSTTVLTLIRNIKPSSRLQVVTNNVETFTRLTSVAGITPMLLGGRIDYRTDNLIGPLAQKSISLLAFDASFFSAWGLDANIGLNEVTVEDAEIKEQVAARSRAVYVAVDHSKLGMTAGGSWQHVPEKTTLATDLLPSDARLADLSGMFGAVY